MAAKLFIPEKIKVGFQKREGTYTGKLAYVIYYDEKGILKKEASWQSWRDKKIPEIEIDNIPQDGFIFNKNIQRTGYNFGSGRSMMRVYDPREFEFEIDMDNLSCILMNTDVSKSEISEKCVFGWSGKDLVLIPINSQEYREAKAYTQIQKNSISTKELVKGFSYKKKKDDDIYIYLGFFEWFDTVTEKVENNNRYGSYGAYSYKEVMKSKGKKHIFYSKRKYYSDYYYALSSSVLGECVSEEVNEKYAELITEFEKVIEKRKLKLPLLNKK
jgi:hypothetical protein